MAALRGSLDRLLGRGTAAVTVPPLDGALKPNNLLENAPHAVGVQEPDNIVLGRQGLMFSSGERVLRLEPAVGAEPVTVITAAGPITAMALAPSGSFAVASDAGGIVLFDEGGRNRTVGSGSGKALSCVTAMGFADDRTLLVCVGSTENAIGDWQRDLLSGGRSGSVWRFDLASGEATQLAGGLGFPNGILAEPDGQIVICESWGKRLVRIGASGRANGPVLEDLPGYPARLSRSARGGYWLSVFAPRSQLIEFIMREPAYRNAMMAEVDPAYWVAPALRSGVSFREPMQGGALKQMGILKPWAPTRSYGLVIELDGNFEAVRSMHSRAGGRRHGVTSAVEQDGVLWVTSKGGDQVVALDLGTDGAK
ncbi:MAG TPA: strictosidine synthase [Acetobacteraceae bacterium]|nr:strictosidine synthase [Acetobacteraceae bacterium]